MRPAKTRAWVIEIDTIALDDYFTPGERVDLIKMDIQGYELHALRGAKRVLQENPDINLLLELSPCGLEQAGVRWEDFLQMLQSFNMELSFVKTRGLVPFDARDVRTDPPSVLTFSRGATSKFCKPDGRHLWINSAKPPTGLAKSMPLG